MKSDVNIDTNLPLFVAEPEHYFGGKWTSEKLLRLEKYLRAYTQALKRQRSFRILYVDAFAGSGYISIKKGSGNSQLVFPEFADESMDRLMGSTRAALKGDSPFYRYIFVEKHNGRSQDLEALKDAFPDRKDAIIIRQGDANEYLQAFCKKTNWKRYRAVVFLDPYGMQVRWSTIEHIAATGSIDLWYLFPLGVGVNRLLKTDGVITPEMSMKLDDCFGTPDWKKVFFSESKQGDLFAHGDHLTKTANFDSIEKFFVERLKTIFPKVAENPYRLVNSRGIPLYSLCFAAANPGRGGDIALKIARHILRN